ncbi:MAG: penicillin-binding protein 2 [bacterium]
MVLKQGKDIRISIVAIFLWLIVLVIITRLFVLQILEHQYYTALAVDTHEIYQQLYPERGNIYIQDSRPGFKQEYPVAIQRPYYLVYAVPRDIPVDKKKAVVDSLSEIFNFSDEKKEQMLKDISKKDDPYEPIENKASEEAVKKLELAKLPGIKFISKNHRYYPENNLMSNLVGFLGSDVDGQLVGRYGIEGAWDQDLSGKSGYLTGKRGAAGSLISLAGKTLYESEDGVDLLLTIDRALQNKACQELKLGMDTYKAKSSALVLLEAKTGAVLAMCSYPGFNPNEYYDVKNIDAYNNTTIFTAYEPGSVFKPITMAMALDLNLVNPNTSFTDPGVRVIDNYRVYNAGKKQYGTVNMTNVLEQSINTGMIWVQEKIGKERFRKYVDLFGFGKKTGLRSDTEVAGDISSISKTADIYYANASFGQGFTSTPLQLAVAYTVFAGDGRLMKPYIIEEVRYPNGQVKKTEPQVVDTVISTRAQKLITGMLISVVEKGHGYAAQIGKYYIAGKTGTAQIASAEGGYSEASNHTFVGYFPADDAKFIMVVKYEVPQREWAESTAAPTFEKVAEFALKYYGIEGER